MISIFKIIPNILSILFVLLVYLFIISIIKMVNSDIAVMLKKKSVSDHFGTYLKLINIRSSLEFPVSESYELAADVKIGRGRGCEIRINDPFLSTEHAEILLRDDVYFLKDMGSTNGTLLNGKKVTGAPIELLNGDKITFGQLSFIFVKNDAEK